MSGRPRQRYGRLCLLGLVAVLLLVSVLTVLRLTTHRGWGDMPFDQGRWKAANTNAPDNVRGEMVRALVRDYHLEGKTRSQVIELLGLPDGVEHQIRDNLDVSPQAADRAREFDYTLGMHSGYRIDYDVLVLSFDQKGVVSRWRIETW